MSIGPSGFHISTVKEETLIIPLLSLFKLRATLIPFKAISPSLFTAVLSSVKPQFPSCPSDVQEKLMACVLMSKHVVGFVK